jgi:hypothetical protein
MGGGQRGDTTLTKTITTSSKTGRSGHLNTLHSFRKLREFIFKQLKQYSAFVWMRFLFYQCLEETDVLSGDEALDSISHFRNPAIQPIQERTGRLEHFEFIGIADPRPARMNSFSKTAIGQ